MSHRITVLWTVPRSVSTSFERMMMARERPVFVKDMAYQAATLLGPDLLERFHNSFLVRDPAATLRSLARRWPDFCDEEGGWQHLDEAVRIVESLAQPRIVLDAELLCADPAGVVREWCGRVGLPSVEDALTWEPGMRPEWDLWDDRHASSARSTGFSELKAPPPPPRPDGPRLHEAYQQALPVYRGLTADAIGRSRK